MIKDVNQEDLKLLLTQDEFIVVYINTPWCKVCNGMNPIIEQIAKETYDIKFYKLNAMENQDYCQQVQFETVPYFAVHHNGNFIGGDTGGSREIIEAIVSMVRQYKAREAGVQL